jgi:four helix bundle protein
MALRAIPGRLLAQHLATGVVTKVIGLARTFRGPGALPRGDQMVRAALSVTSNIAEACGRTTVQEFRRFIGYAKGSAHELRAQLNVARLVDSPRAREVRALENRTTLIIKMLTRLQQHPPPQD